MLLGDAFVERVLEGFPVTEAVSHFGHPVAFRLGSREIAHLESGDRLDLRLTLGVISERREEFLADPRVELRLSASDWVTLLCRAERDVAWILALIDDAVEANH